MAPTYSTNVIRMRRSLVEQHCIEAVVALPSKLLLHTAIPTTLWVLRSPNSLNPARIRFIDASAFDPSESFPIQTWLFEPGPYDDRRLSWAEIPGAEVLADDRVSLNPRQWTTPVVDTEQIVERYRLAASRLYQALALVEQNADIIPSNYLRAARTVSVRTLEEQEALQIIPSRSRGRRTEPDGEDTESPWLVTSRQVSDRFSDLPQFDGAFSVIRADGELPSNTAGFDGPKTEPGDVLIANTRTVRAVVDERGGRRLGAGIIQLRVDQRQFDPHYVAECLAGSWNQRFETGSPTPHANVRDLEIPLLPIDDQRRLVDAVSQARRLGAAGRRVAAASDELVTAQLDAVRFDVRLVN
jgi:hypothetical protein